MKPADILRLAYGADIEISLAPSGNLLVRPADRLTARLRELLVAHKPELVEFLRDAERTTAELLAAALQACDFHHDTERARQEMRADCLATAPHLRADLLAHFRQTYGGKPC